MSAREEFIELYTTHIHRDGSAALLDYLTSRSDFFTAPASARFHGAYAGGLCDHSVNVYHCLTDYLARERVQELYGLDYPPESVAVVSLLHDLCKIGCYKSGTRNVKNAEGKWEAVPTFHFEDPLPYGHGEKSVYIISGFMRLTREEAMAIRWHMGFSGSEDPRTIGQALEQYPLAFALSVADMEATYFLEGERV
ncbi:hydrolase [Pseudoflavonifractor phocaeensis]|uniref:hydrolase n=1 Tax=Pseudoflavonifractor phocaeensis TaxID=1870988 RepID=UPI0019571750|nr:hydrolase [Pseudoflavonifractor phocaeensis]MBM6938029.1 hydrolase [Pseudoflavonifractor phocaeensis]